jgi:hypothetical protein
MNARRTLVLTLVALLAAPPVYPGSESASKDCRSALLTSDIASYEREIRELRLERQGGSSYSSEIQELRRKIRESFNEIREIATTGRVEEAEKWVAKSLEHARQKLAHAESQLAAINECPSDDLLTWGAQKAGCAYWRTRRALDQIASFMATVGISFTSEIVGLDSAGVAAVAAARASVLDEIESARIALQEANAAGDTDTARRVQLQLTALAIQKWTLPYLAGVGSQLKASVLAGKEWLVTPRTEEQKLVASAARADFVADLGANAYSALSAFTLKKMRSNSYVFFDYAYRFALVALANTIVNFVKAFPGLPWPSTTPWHLVPNAGVMMAVQSEAAARTTVVQTGTLPPKDFDEVHLRMPRIIAGKTGWTHESWNRLTTFAAQMPMELPVLWAFTLAYMAPLGVIDPLTLSGWLAAGLASVTFLSKFGIYLIVKWSFADKLAELGVIPSLRSLASGEYNRAHVELAKQNAIPITSEEVVDPRTGEKSRAESVAWQGQMWRQWAACFVPEDQKADEFSYPDKVHEFSYSDFAKYFRSGKWRPRLEAFRADYEKLLAFNKTPEMQALNASPAGKLRRRVALAEFAYRVTNTGIDTLAAILLAGSEMKAGAKP